MTTILTVENGRRMQVGFSTIVEGEIPYPQRFISNFQLEWVLTNQVKIKPGACRSDDNTENILATNDILLDIIATGVKRFGYVQLETESVFDSVTEDFVYKDTVLRPSIRYQDWYWNVTTQNFQTTPP